MPDWPSLLLGAALGIPATTIGLFLTFVLAAPHIRLSTKISYSMDSAANRRYRFHFENRGPLTVIDLRARARFVMDTKPRTTAIPVPITTDEGFRLRTGANRLPRLMLDQVAWTAYLPPGFRPPDSTNDLGKILSDLNARIVLEVVASSEIFQVRRVWQATYFGDDIQRSPADLERLEQLAERNPPKAPKSVPVWGDGDEGGEEEE